MNNYLILTFYLLVSTTTLLAQFTSDSLDFQFKSTKVLNSEMVYWEKGSGSPILFLHGIPTNSLLWRNIAPNLDTLGRTISVDLIGYGKSGNPNDFDYSIQSQYDYLEGFIDSLKLTNITLVLHDFGSLLGLKYANKHADNIKSIVMMESLFMPSELWYNQLTFSSKTFFWMAKQPKVAKYLFMNNFSIYKTMVKQGTIRKLTDKEMYLYTDYYKNDSIRRKMVLKGSPAAQLNKGVSKVEGDFSDVMTTTAYKFLSTSKNFPILLFYSKPGMINKHAAIEYAEKNFINLKLVKLPKGKHFLPEDYPNEISQEISLWIKELQLSNKKNRQ